jgi:hypothetical protein
MKKRLCRGKKRFGQIDPTLADEPEKSVGSSEIRIAGRFTPDWLPHRRAVGEFGPLDEALPVAKEILLSVGSRKCAILFGLQSTLNTRNL